MNSYATISSFGKTTPVDGSNDPLTYCLVETMDRNFQHGSNSVLYGPRSFRCQAYMADRAAQEWDGFSEYFYRTQNAPPGSSSKVIDWPAPNTLEPSWQIAGGFSSGLTMGDQFLGNVAQRKYCTFPNCIQTCEPFNPLDPDSPTIQYYTTPSGGQNCVPVCRVNPQEIDDDPVMTRMLENPRAAAPTLINLCNTARREGTDLKGTRLGAFCKKYHAAMDA